MSLVDRAQKYRTTPSTDDEGKATELVRKERIERKVPETLPPTCQAGNTCRRIGPCRTWPGFDRDCSIDLGRKPS